MVVAGVADELRVHAGRQPGVAAGDCRLNWVKRAGSVRIASPRKGPPALVSLRRRFFLKGEKDGTRL